MEPKDLWQLFEATGDPMAYMMFKAAVGEQPDDQTKQQPRE